MDENQPEININDRMPHDEIIDATSAEYDLSKIKEKMTETEYNNLNAAIQQGIISPTHVKEIIDRTMDRQRNNNGR